MSSPFMATRIAHAYLLRLAEATSPDLDLEGMDDASDRLFSGKARRLLFRAFGRQGVPFFDFYKELHRVWAGWPVPEGGLLAEFLPAYRKVYRTLEGEEAKNQAGELLSRLKPWIKRIESGAAGTNVWRAVIESYVQAMLAFGIDQNVWLVTKRLGGSGGLPWQSLWQMPKKQQRLERIKRDDPELFSTLMEREETRERLNDAIQRQVAEAGLLPGEEYVVIAGRRTQGGKLKGYGRPVQTGTDPVTGEVSYFDEDGNRSNLDEYREAALKRMEALKGLRKVNISEKALDDLRTIPEEVMRKLDDKPVQYKALTDDPTKSTALTRIYPVVKVWGVEVVASGRYRGIALPDLVNRAGRQIEGSVYDYDTATARPVKLETKNPDGTPNIKTEREPYVTVSGGKLFLKIPFRKAKKNDPYSMGTTPQRQAVRKLADAAGSTVKYLRDGQNTTFAFEPKDFAAVRSALGGMALSNSALKMIKKHFRDLAKAELATASENLKHYTNEALGGFGEGAHPLTVKQKQALAWLDANGNKGVCALDTGLGKTVTSVAIMQKLKRDGLMEDPEAGNGRYLYVCPAALKGNLAKEMEKFMADPAALLDFTDVMSYAEFRKARGRLSKVPLVNPTGRRKFETKWEATSFGEDYIAVFFDEAQALKNPGSQRSMAAASLNHPRKVLMTASPMERSPMEVYALQAISNNIDLTAKGPRKDMANFKRRFSETVGGRVVGIKSDDPDTLREFRVWVKRNLYFADKQDPEAILLPALKTDGGTALGMPEEIETKYKAVAKTIARELRAAAAKQFKPARGAYQRYVRGLPDGATPTPREVWDAQQKQRANALAVESLRMKLGKEFAELTRLSNLPNWTFDDVPAPTAKNPKATKRVWTRDPDLPNPKVDFAVGKVGENIAGGKILLFTDSPEMATESAIRMSEQFPGVGHIVGYSSKIELWKDGTVLLTYTPRRYKNFLSNEWYDKTEWKVPVLQSLMAGIDPVDQSNIPAPSTATLTGSYAVGQNLQMFNTVIHLDRDTWNAETMKQRTARAWRSGQKDSVEEYTLDMTYSDDRKKGDQTLDEVRQTIQDMDSSLFNEVVNQSQSQNLGEEWLTMKKNESELFEVNRQMMEMAMSPYLARMGEEER